MKNDTLRIREHGNARIDRVRAPAEHAENAECIGFIFRLADDLPVEIHDRIRADDTAIPVRGEHGVRLAQRKLFHKFTRSAGRNMLIRIAHDDLIIIPHQRKHFAPPRGLGSKDQPHKGIIPQTKYNAYSITQRRIMRTKTGNTFHHSRIMEIGRYVKYVSESFRAVDAQHRH